MIKDNELTIENIIQVKGDAGAYRVLGVVSGWAAKKNEPQIFLERPHGHTEAIGISRIKGIPLNLFTVKKLGFIFAGAHWYHPDNPDWFIWNFLKNKVEIFKAITHHRNAGNKPHERHIELRYVHELQNRFLLDNGITLQFDTMNMIEHKI